MKLSDVTVEAWEQSRASLGVSAEATEPELRAAYLDKVRQHPPDKDPDAFEKIRDAFDLLRDPRNRARQVLSADPLEPLTSLISGLPTQHRFTGPKLWLDALREKARETRT